MCVYHCVQCKLATSYRTCSANVVSNDVGRNGGSENINWPVVITSVDTTFKAQALFISISLYQSWTTFLYLSDHFSAPIQLQNYYKTLKEKGSSQIIKRRLKFSVGPFMLVLNRHLTPRLFSVCQKVNSKASGQFLKPFQSCSLQQLKQKTNRMLH